MKTSFLILFSLAFATAADLAAEEIAGQKSSSLFYDFVVNLEKKSDGLTAEIKSRHTERKEVIPDGLITFRLRDIEMSGASGKLELKIRNKEGQEIKPKESKEGDLMLRPAPKGALMIHGGGQITRDFVDSFIQLAGGKDAAVVVIPTAMGGEIDPERYREGWLARAGFSKITVLHTRDPEVADTADFVKPLKDASAVWLSGGRQWRTADAYLNTNVQDEIQRLYERGGVVAGSSAGATIQGSYLVRGDTRGNRLMMSPGHEEGFGLLPNAAIDQHVIARDRLNDIVPVIERFPHLLGIGIDEGAAIVVKNGEFEVIGSSKVAIYDARRWNQQAGDASAKEKKYFFLEKGGRFNWRTRKVIEKQPR